MRNRMLIPMLILLGGCSSAPVKYEWRHDSPLQQNSPDRRYYERYDYAWCHSNWIPKYMTYARTGIMPETQETKFQIMEMNDFRQFAKSIRKDNEIDKRLRQRALRLCLLSLGYTPYERD